MLKLDFHPTGRHFLQIPGPSPVPDRVLRAMSLPTIDHRGPEFAALGLKVLADIGLPKGAAPQALLLFNIGVEIGQLMFIGAALALIAAWRALSLKMRLSLPGWNAQVPAYAIGGLSAYWLIERTIAAV